MSTIRRQSIISSALVYFGFAVGFVNTLLFARLFSPAQYGLIQIFGAIANIMFIVACLGMQSYIQKFYPYYADNLPREKNDMLSWALLNSLIGFVGVILAGWVAKDFVIRKFGANSPELVRYYYWIFPFGFGLTLYSVFEAYAWQLKKSVLTNFLREILFRLVMSVLILLSITGILASFATFIKLYAFLYLILTIVLAACLLKAGELHFTFSPSRVTRKFFSKIRTLVLLVWSGNLLYYTSNFFALIVIAAVVPKGLAVGGIYALALYIGSLMQAPQRVIITAALGPLSKAWKDKDMEKIRQIYIRSSINQLIFSIGLFILIWINFTDGVHFLGLKPDYLAARPIFLFVGLRLIVDMGTGLNSQIIGTSTFWRFDFFSGLVLAVLTLPLNYILAKKMGGIGPAIADLITFVIYNFIRFLFLYRKFKLQPFTRHSVFTILLGLAGWFPCWWLFRAHNGLGWMVLRTVLFGTIYIGGVLGLHLSEDVLPVWATLQKRGKNLWKVVKGG